jgi:glycosyltransferase involved in cell wall biosynthesis
VLRGGLYLIDEMLAFFAAFKRRYPDAAFLILTQDPADVVTEAAGRLGIDTADLIIQAASRDRMPGLIALADLGVCLIRPAPSKAASFPTKWAEMLACGLPVVTNGGVGDAEQIFGNARLGQLVDRFDVSSYESALDRFEARREGAMAVRETARPLLDLPRALAAYNGIYLSLSAAPGLGGTGGF